MIDINSTIPDPENKSFVEESDLLRELRSQFAPKTCFNPYCNDKGCGWIRIIGTAAGYRDHVVPYCVCDKCYSPFIGWGSRLSIYESFKPIPKVCYNPQCNNEGKHWIDIYNKIISEAEPNDSRWLGAHMPYWICVNCFEALGPARRDYLTLSVRFNKIEAEEAELPWDGNCDKLPSNRVTKEEDRIAITIKDWLALLESTKSGQIEENRI